MPITYKTIAAFLHAIKVKRIRYSAAGIVMDACVLGISAVLMSAWIDLVVPIPYAVRMVLRYFVPAASVIYGLIRARRFAGLTLKKVSLILGKEMNIGDRIVSAFELSNTKTDAGISEDLKIAFIGDTMKDIEARTMPKSWKMSAFFHPCMRLAGIVSVMLIMIGVYPYPLARFFPRIYGRDVSREINRYFEIMPGNASYIEGESVTIQVTVKEDAPAPFSLYVRSSLSDWEKAVLSRKDEKKWIYRIEHLVNTVEYYLRMRDLYTPRFALVPRVRPALTQIRFMYRYPAYTGTPQTERIDDPFIKALPGTTVTIEADVNVPLESCSLYFSDGRIIASEISKQTVRSTFLLDKQGSCWFVLTGAQGVTGESIHLPIYVEDDREPSVSILAPPDGLVTSPDQSIPVTYTAEDDFGLTRIELIYRRGYSSAEKRVILRRFDDDPAEHTETYIWRNFSMQLQAGDIIEYYIEAQDNDILSGPKKGRSEARTIEMISYRKEHERISQRLEEFRQGLLDTLGDQMLAHESLKKITESDAQQEQKEAQRSLADQIAHMQRSIRDRLRSGADDLKNLLPLMEQDPLGDLSIFMEHRAMQSNLESLVRNEAHQTIEQLQAGTYKKAQESQEALIAELEKMSLLSEDVLKRRTMNDLINTAESIVNSSEGLIDGIQQASVQPSAEDMALLKQTLEDLSKMMQEISQYLKEMPQELPDDFINQEAMKSLDTGKMQELSNSIAEALAAGDFKGALQMARSLAEQARSMLETMRSAASSVSGGGMNQENGLVQEMQESMQELEQIVVEQNNILSSTRDYEKIRTERVSALQEKLIERLLKKQRELIKAAEKLKTKMIQQESAVRAAWTDMRWQYEQAQKNMNSVAAEFEEKRVFKAQDHLQKAIEQLTGARTKVRGVHDRLVKEGEKNDPPPGIRGQVSSHAYALEKMTGIITGETEILEQLKTDFRDEKIFSSKEEKDMEKLGQLQVKLRGRTQKVTERLQEFSRQTALLGPETFNRFRSASAHMGEAGKKLSESNSADAVPAEESALDNLLQGKKSLEESIQSMQQMMAGAGKPMAGFFQSSGSSGFQPGGVTGIRQGEVHIPSADEYEPPRAFREEIMESIKERYPQRYEPVIKEYYQKLVE